MTKSEAARAFSVSLSSVKRYAKAAAEGRSLSPGKAPGKKPKLDEKARRLLEADVRSVLSPSSKRGRSTYRRFQGSR